MRIHDCRAGPDEQFDHENRGKAPAAWRSVADAGILRRPAEDCMKYLSLAVFASLSLATESASPANPPVASDLDWMAGHWCSADAQERIEEYWLPARGGMLIGVSRTTKGERTVSFEFMRIAGLDAGLAFIAQPNGSAPVTFRWTAGGRDWARFENPAHDFPQLVEYGRNGGKLRARIAGPGKDRKPTSISFEYEQCPAGPPGG
jgi:hypothetical protein